MPRLKNDIKRYDLERNAKGNYEIRPCENGEYVSYFVFSVVDFHCDLLIGMAKKWEKDLFDLLDEKCQDDVLKAELKKAKEGECSADRQELILSLLKKILKEK